MIPYGKVSKIIKSGNTYTVTYKMYYKVYGESGSTYTGTWKVKLKKASK
ncbi:MAG: hypothetical protein LUI13_09720 [Lachnospiraceae bacterium]|nr:hypothetical protein [Lachnospiraceae bacterium]